MQTTKKVISIISSITLLLTALMSVMVIPAAVNAANGDVSMMPTTLAEVVEDPSGTGTGTYSLNGGVLSVTGTEGYRLQIKVATTYNLVDNPGLKMSLNATASWKMAWQVQAVDESTTSWPSSTASFSAYFPLSGTDMCAAGDYDVTVPFADACATILAGAEKTVKYTQVIILLKSAGSFSLSDMTATSGAAKGPAAVPGDIYHPWSSDKPENVTVGLNLLDSSKYAGTSLTFNADGSMSYKWSGWGAQSLKSFSNVDLASYPYLYYSFEQTPGSTMTFAMYASSPWLSSRDKTLSGTTMLNNSSGGVAAENYMSGCETGCINLYEWYAKSSPKTISELKFYGTGTVNVKVNYMFLGSAPQEPHPSLMPKSESDVSVSGGTFTYQNGTLLVNATGACTVEWPLAVTYNIKSYPAVYFNVGSTAASGFNITWSYFGKTDGYPNIVGDWAPAWANAPISYQTKEINFIGSPNYNNNVRSDGIAQIKKITVNIKSAGVFELAEMMMDVSGKATTARTSETTTTTQAPTTTTTTVTTTTVTTTTTTAAPTTVTTEVQETITMAFADVTGAKKGDIVTVTFSIDSTTGVCNFDGTMLYDEAVMIPAQVGGRYVTKGSAMDGDMLLAASMASGVLKVGCAGLNNTAPTGDLFNAFFEIVADGPVASSLSFEMRTIKVAFYPSGPSYTPEYTIVPGDIEVIGEPTTTTTTTTTVAPTTTTTTVAPTTTTTVAPSLTEVSLIGGTVTSVIKGDIISVTFSIDSLHGVCNFDGPLVYDPEVFEPVKVNNRYAVKGDAIAEGMFESSAATGVLKVAYIDYGNSLPSGELFTAYFLVKEDMGSIMQIGFKPDDIKVAYSYMGDSYEPEWESSPADIEILNSVTVIYDIGLGSDNPTQQVKLKDNGGIDSDDLTYEAPIKEGKTFESWVVTDTDFSKNTITVQATYSVNDPTPVSGYTVTLTSGKFAKGEAFGKTIWTGLSYNDIVVFTADKAPEGKVFDYWKNIDTEEKLGADETITVIVCSDLNFEAVYRDAGTEPTPIESRVDLMAVFEENGNITFVARYAAVEGDTVTSYGIVYAPATVTYEELCDPDNEGVTTKKVEAQQHSKTDQYSVTIMNVKSGKSRIAVAYITVKHEDQTVDTYYSKIALQATSTKA